VVPLLREVLEPPTPKSFVATRRAIQSDQRPITGIAPIEVFCLDASATSSK
jgi:hypothetical protein